jgi:hypothetical protein
MIDDLHVCGTGGRPNETYPVFLIDPDRMLALPIIRQGMKLVSRGASRILEPRRRFNRRELATRDLEDFHRKSLRTFAFKNQLRRVVPEAPDHPPFFFDAYLFTIQNDKKRVKGCVS